MVAEPIPAPAARRCGGQGPYPGAMTGADRSAQSVAGEQGRAVTDDLPISRSVTVPAAALSWRFSRSSGPGGQSVNTADSRVELIVDLSAVPDLSEHRLALVRARLSGRIVDDRLVVAAAEHRSQLRNRRAARERVAELVRGALAPPPKKSRPRRPSQGAKRRRLEAKKRRSQTTALRRRPEYCPSRRPKPPRTATPCRYGRPMAGYGVFGRLSRAPMRALAATVGVLILVGFTVWSVLAVHPRGQADSDPPATVFGTDRAMTDIDAISRAPHPTGSPVNDEVRDYLLGALDGIGVEHRVQSAFGANARSPEETNAAYVDNIVATIPGTDPTGRLYLAAHYDTAQFAPGA